MVDLVGKYTNDCVCLINRLSVKVRYVYVKLSTLLCSFKDDLVYLFKKGRNI